MLIIKLRAASAVKGACLKTSVFHKSHVGVGFHTQSFTANMRAQKGRSNRGHSAIKPVCKRSMVYLTLHYLGLSKTTVTTFLD